MTTLYGREGYKWMRGKIEDQLEVAFRTMDPKTEQKEKTRTEYSNCLVSVFNRGTSDGNG